MMKIAWLILLALSLPSLSRAIEGRSIPAGSKIYVAPMDGFGTYVIAAIHKKNVPVVIVTEREQAIFEITGSSDSQKAGWARVIFTGQTGSREEAGINVVDIKNGTVVFAYAVNKANSIRGKQSAAESCAKNLKNQVEKR